MPRGYNAHTDVMSTTADGRDLSDLFAKLQQVPPTQRASVLGARRAGLHHFSIAHVLHPISHASPSEAIAPNINTLQGSDLAELATSATPGTQRTKTLL